MLGFRGRGAAAGNGYLIAVDLEGASNGNLLIGIAEAIARELKAASEIGTGDDLFDDVSFEFKVT